MAQQDIPPVGRLVPAEAWSPGTVYGYPISIELPLDLSPGEYRLLVGVYVWPDMTRLPVTTDIPGADGDVVEIGDVRVSR